MSQKWTKSLSNLEPPLFQLIGGFVGYNCDQMKGNEDCCQAMKGAVLCIKILVLFTSNCLFTSSFEKKKV